METDHLTEPAAEYNPWGEDYLNSVPKFRGEEAPTKPDLPNALIDNLNTAIADIPPSSNDRPTLESLDLQHQRDYAQARQEDFDKLRMERPEYSGEDGFLKYLDELLSKKRQSGESSLRRDQEIDYLEKLIDRLYHMTGRADAKFEAPAKPAETTPEAEAEPISEPKPETKPEPEPESAPEVAPAPESKPAVPAVLASGFPIPARPRRRSSNVPTIDLPETPAGPRRRRAPVMDFPETPATPRRRRMPAAETPIPAAAEPLPAQEEPSPEQEKRPTKEWSKLQNDFLWFASTEFGGDLEAAYDSLPEEKQRELEITAFLSLSDNIILTPSRIDAAVYHVTESGPDNEPLPESEYHETRRERKRAKAHWRESYEANSTSTETMDLLDFYVQQAAEIFGPESDMYYAVVSWLYGGDGLRDTPESQAAFRREYASSIAYTVENTTSGQIQLDGSNGKSFLIPGGHIPIERMLLAKYKNASPAPNPTLPRRRPRNPL